MPDFPLATALAAGPVVLDGGLATELEVQGHDLSSALWSARLLRDDPEAVVAAHATFAAAGAQVATTASYQVSVEGLAAVGLDAAEARRLVVRSVHLAERGAPEAWIAGAVALQTPGARELREPIQRSAILQALNENVASPAQLARALDEPLGNVS